MAQIMEKIHAKAIVDVSRGGKFWKLFCLEGGANDLSRGRKALPGGPEVVGNYTVQINYKMNFIQDSFQRFSLDFKSTFH